MELWLLTLWWIWLSGWLVCYINSPGSRFGCQRKSLRSSWECLVYVCGHLHFRWLRVSQDLTTRPSPPSHHPAMGRESPSSQQALSPLPDLIFSHPIHLSFTVGKSHGLSFFIGCLSKLQLRCWCPAHLNPISTGKKYSLLPVFNFCMVLLCTVIQLLCITLEVAAFQQQQSDSCIDRVYEFFSEMLWLSFGVKPVYMNRSSLSVLPISLKGCWS